MKWLAICFAMLVPSLLHAQVNTEKLRMARGEDGTAGQIELGFSLTLGNSRLTQLDFGPSVITRHGRHQVFLLGDLSWVSSDEVSIINRGFSHVRYNVDISPRLIGEAFTQLQYDRAQNLESRFLLGSGVRIPLIDRPTGFVALGVTAMYEHEELTDGQTSDTPRGSSYLSLRATSPDRLSATATVYVQPALDDLNDLRVLQESRLSVSIASHLALVVTFNYRLDTRPPAGIKKYDLKLKNGLTLSI